MPPGILAKSEYQQILQNPGVYLTDANLKLCQVEKDPITRLPRARSGGLALTYKISNNNKILALRCFHKLSPLREQNYRAISKFLTLHKSNILIDITYQPQGIRYQDNYYPVTVMEWVEGETLGTFIFKNIKSKGAIDILQRRFRNVVQELGRLKIAHGDLSHTNIMLTNGNVILIDYDGMYVPELCGQKSTELGNKNFQHPGRNDLFFGSDLDRFSEIVIYLALKAISISPTLYQTYGLGGEGLLFTQSDFREPYTSKLLADIENLVELAEPIRNFKRICQSSISDIPTLEDFIKNSPVVVTSVEPLKVYQITAYHWPIDATDIGELLENENENVVVIGRIDVCHRGTTWNNEPYVFLNFGRYPKHTFTVVLWSEMLRLFHGAGIHPEDFQGRWVSISGIVSQYHGKPQILLESPADIAIISETEVQERLNRKYQTKTHKRKPVVRTSISGPVNSPTILYDSGPRQSGATEKLNKLYGESGILSSQLINPNSISTINNPSSTSVPTGKPGNIPQVPNTKPTSPNSGQGLTEINRKKREKIWKRITNWLTGNT